MKPITVLIPIYNAESFLKETIDSVLSQTFSNFDLFAMDDGSTDNSPAIVKSYNDPRVKYIRCTHDFIGTLNKGIELSESKYIALLDHDDIMLPYRLQVQYVFMETHPEIAVCGGFMQNFGLQTNIQMVPLSHPDIIQNMLQFSPILNPTGFIRRKVLVDNDIKYKRGYSFSTDYKLWSDIAKIGKLATIPKILTRYRIHKKQTSNLYHDQCLKGRMKVKMEILSYFLSHLKKDHEIAYVVEQKLMPFIEGLQKLGFFSENVYSVFIYSLITGLLKKGAIVLENNY